MKRLLTKSNKDLGYILAIRLICLYFYLSLIATAEEILNLLF